VKFSFDMLGEECYPGAAERRSHYVAAIDRRGERID